MCPYRSACLAQPVSVSESRSGARETGTVAQPEWTQEPDHFVLRASRYPVLRRWRVEIDADGVTAVGFRTRRWRWDAVAILTWDTFRTAFLLALCVRGDPWVKLLTVGRKRSRDLFPLLEAVRPTVEAHGARVVAGETAATTWWVDDPESKSA